MIKLVPALCLASLLSGCLSFGAKPPPTLMTLTSAQERAAGATGSASEGETITIVPPQAARELQTVRVPVRQSDVAIAYLKDAQWVELPANLFARLVSETVAATTGRVVLDPRQFTFDPGTRLTGTLQEFGLDATRMEVVAVYDAALARRGGGVTTRRFEARVPVSVADAASVSPALNQAANEVAAQVAAWIGGGAS
jgi:cholesterol transport system auxiliary component